MAVLEFLTDAIPEPTSIPLFGMDVIAIGARRVDTNLAPRLVRGRESKEF